MKEIQVLKEILDIFIEQKYIFSYSLSLTDYKGKIIFEEGNKRGEKFKYKLGDNILELILDYYKDKEIIKFLIDKYISLVNRIINLEERIKELNILQEIGFQINSTFRLKDLLNLIMTLSKETLEAEASSLMLLDEKTNDLTFEIALGEKGDVIKKFRIPLGEGIAGWVAKTGEPLIANNVEEDPRFAKKYDSATSFRTKSILCVPLKTKEKIVGVIEVLNKKGNDNFDENDLNLLQAIANQAAIAIENARLYQNLKELFFDTVESLAFAIEAKDPYTHGHSRRVTQYSELIAEEMGFDENFIEKIRLSALLHDIGKIGIDEVILRKKEKLTEEERKEIEKHPLVGRKILEPLSSLEDIIPGVEEHHERYDGSGYPKKLKGEQISILGRIIAVADTLDAMTSDRPYRKGLSMDVAIMEIENQKGKQFDPLVVSALLSLWQKGKLCSGS
ncbi:MAG: HD domain-containing protein [Dictyoglomus sp.]|nr:HD domain-containing protein [Dictyoglomus sp.]MCX7942221.1 HD domain-containing protein [Dictyoglomaceae bacterium]MDW8188684.1 HD domain-containing protein [Dictyoglomus sp.]